MAGPKHRRNHDYILFLRTRKSELEEGATTLKERGRHIGSLLDDALAIRTCG
jgi:hypothetical protein